MKIKINPLQTKPIMLNGKSVIKCKFLLVVSNVLPEIGMLATDNDTHKNFLWTLEYENYFKESPEFNMVFPIVVCDTETINIGDTVMQKRSEYDIEVFIIKTEYHIARDMQTKCVAYFKETSDAFKDVVNGKLNHGDTIYVEVDHNNNVMLKPFTYFKSNEFTDLLIDLSNVQRYDYTMDNPGCDCCGPSVEFNEDNKYGDWIKAEHIKEIITKYLNK